MHSLLAAAPSRATHPPSCSLSSSLCPGRLAVSYFSRGVHRDRDPVYSTVEKRLSRHVNRIPSESTEKENAARKEKLAESSRFEAAKISVTSVKRGIGRAFPIHRSRSLSPKARLSTTKRLTSMCCVRQSSAFPSGHPFYISLSQFISRNWEGTLEKGDFRRFAQTLSNDLCTFYRFRSTHRTSSYSVVAVFFFYHILHILPITVAENARGSEKIRADAINISIYSCRGFSSANARARNREGTTTIARLRATVLSRKYDFVRGKALDADSYELHRSFNHITRLRRASVSPSFCFDLIE